LGQRRSAQFAPWATPALVAVVGILLSVLSFAFARNFNNANLQAAFEERAARRLVLLQDAINVHVTLLRSIAGLYAASDFVKRQEFRIFVSNQPLAKFGDARISWVPRVTASQRAKIEKAARADGLSSFHIWSNESDRDDVADPTREYYPIFYVEPQTFNADVLGYDVWTDPEIRRALEGARDSGEPSGTGRINLNPNGEPGVVMAFPVYASKTAPGAVANRRLQLAGFAVGAFQLRKLIDAAVLSGEEFLQDIYIYDEDAIPPEPRLLFFSGSREHSEPAAALSQADIVAAYHWVGTIDAPGRKWTVIFRPAPGYFPAWGNWITWLMPGIGLLLTVLVVSYEWRRTFHTRRIEALAADLSASHARLVSEIAEHEETGAQLRQAQKVEAVGHLTGGVAHDFNNLLTIIIGNLEVAHEQVASGSAVDSHIRSALTAAIRGASLTQRLLAFARRQVLDPEILDVNEVVGAMYDLLRRALGESIRIETALAKTLWLALADRNQVESALLNLAINARDAMPQGGRLTIETQNVSLDADYARRNEDVLPGDYILLAVTDTGHGMTPDVLKQAIEPFFTTKEAGKGTGLGLSSIYGFAKQSGGHLKMYSEVGRGTSVRLYLPRARGVEAALGDVDTEADLRGGRESILVVEDEPNVREIAVSHLTEHGYRVLQADRARAALEMIESHPGEIDMLLTDVVLAGGMNGRGLAAEATRRIPWLKVLFMSGYSEDMNQQGRLEAGVILLQKPFRKAELLRAVRGALDRD
jgi:signal transduction histidine kinase